MTPNEKLVAFMQAKQDALPIKEPPYFSESDKEAIMAWPEATATRVVYKLQSALAFRTLTLARICPFCILHIDNNCDGCEYEPAPNDDDEDNTTRCDRDGSRLTALNYTLIDIDNRLDDVWFANKFLGRLEKILR